MSSKTLVPPELVHRILLNLDGVQDARTLQQTALVSPTFLESSRRRQFHSFHLRASKDGLNFDPIDHTNLVQLFEKHPILMTYIRELRLLWPGNADANEDSTFFTLIRLLADSNLQIYELAFMTSSHWMDNGEWSVNHRFIQSELFVRLVKKTSNHLNSVILHNPCSLFPMELFGQLRSLKKLEILMIARGCGIDEDPNLVLSRLEGAEHNEEPLYLERLDIHGAMPGWLALCLRSPKFPIRFSKLREASLRNTCANSEETTAWELVSSAKDSLELLILTNKEYMKYPVKIFTKLRYLYAYAARENLVRTIHTDKYEDECFPEPLQIFGIILDEPENFGLTSFPYYHEGAQEVMDVKLTSRMNFDSKFELFIMGRALGNIKALNQQIRDWFLTLEENEMLGRCEVINGRRDFYRSLTGTMEYGSNLYRSKES